MLNISCLHPAKADIAVFEAARRALRLDDVMLKHRVRTDLVAGDAGRLSQSATRHTAAELVSLAKGASGLLVTAPAPATVSRAASMLGIPIVEADRALAEAAVSKGGTVTALCVDGSSLATVRSHLDVAAVATGATVEVRLVAGAAALQAAGRETDYLRTVADAADFAFEEGAGTVALAQTSMAGAAALVRSGRVITGPAAGLAAIVAAIQAAASKSS